MSSDAVALPVGNDGVSGEGDQRFDLSIGLWTKGLFIALLVGGFAYAVANIIADTHGAGEPLALGALAFLAFALLIALGFEFVNGFHDTANAVATVIYTNAMPPVAAVVWSGVWNFLGVLSWGGAVAYSIITLLPVDLILHIGNAQGYAMIFALLIAALTWNLATWYVGLPNSSSHALIGSILGVGIANQLIQGPNGTGGVDWAQAEKVLMALLLSPALGFVAAGLLLWTLKRTLRSPTLSRTPKGDEVPPKGIRALLIFSCTAVSFVHGGNDGQKGMGLIMLILIGIAPTAYSINRALPDSSSAAIIATAEQAQQVFVARAGDVHLSSVEARATLQGALQTRQFSSPQVFAALDTATADITAQLREHGALRHVPAEDTRDVRNAIYLVTDTLTHIEKTDQFDTAFPGAAGTAIKAYEHQLTESTRFIPLWVKISVALALGLGTMVGWKRIVVTVGERIGKAHMTYGMGLSAELVAAGTILLALLKGWPVSTTHVLSSGVAGTMVADGAGLQVGTLRNIALAWILTLPAVMLISGALYWLLRSILLAAGF